jgi:hypothetical protein
MHDAQILCALQAMTAFGAKRAWQGKAARSGSQGNEFARKLGKKLLRCPSARLKQSLHLCTLSSAPIIARATR